MNTDTILRYDRETNVVVAANVSDTFSGVMRIPSGAEGIVKTGEGEWTLPVGGVWSRDASLPVVVHEGTVTLTDGGAIPAASGVPPAAMSKAAVWLEAGTNTEEWSQDSSRIAGWYDVRETKDGEGVWSSNWPRATSEISKDAASGSYTVTNYPVAHQAETASGTRPMLYFHGYGEGGWMRFRDKSHVVQNLSRIHHAFMVVDLEEYVGFLLDITGGGVFLHPVNTSPGNFTEGSTSYFQVRSGDGALACGRFYRDGALCNPETTKVRKGVQVLEVECSDILGVAGTIFNDRGIKGRFGGDYVGEVVLFTNRLTQAERLDVSEYLVRKWVGEPVRTLPQVTLSENASLSCTANVSVSGGGRLLLDEVASIAFTPGSPFFGLLVKSADVAATVVEAGELAVSVASGDRISAGKDSHDAVSFSRTVDAGDAAQGIATHSGDASLRLQSLAGIKSFTTGAGELILSGPQRDRALVSTNAYADIAGGNGDFEQAGAGWTFKTYTIDKPNGAGTATGTAKVMSYASLQPGMGNNWWFSPASSKDYDLSQFTATPDGGVVAGIKIGGEFSAEVSVPETGDWEFSYYGTGRSGYDYGDVTLSLVDETVSPYATNTFARYLQPAGSGWRPYRYLLRNLEAGSYRLVVAMKGVRPDADCHAMFDVFRMRLVSSPGSSRRTAEPPNGSFDVIDCPYASRTTYSYDVTAPGWTLVQGEHGTAAVSTNGPAGNLEACIAVRGQETDNRSWYDPHTRYGHAQLHLRATGGYAETAAFRLPAGTWQLCARAAYWTFTDVTSFYYLGRNGHQAAKFSASVLINGDEISLGTTADISNVEMKDLVLDTPFTVSESDSIVLRLRQTKAMTSTQMTDLAVDSVYFKRLDGADGAELVQDGSFETGSGWTYDRNRGSDTNSTDDLYYSNSYRKAAGDKNYGYTVCDGPMALLIVDVGRAMRTVTFPEAGLYRLSMWTRARYYTNNTGVVNSTEYAGNQVQAWIVQNGTSATQEIYRTISVCSTNFLEHVALFRVDAAGEYTFGLQGCNRYPDSITKTVSNGRDANVFVDSVSIRKAGGAEPPELDEDLQLTLTDTARLRLDYEGTNTIKRLRLGGHAESGLIDASHPSGLVSGTGCLYVPPYGTVMLFR